jgi:hypothetical protein
MSEQLSRRTFSVRLLIASLAGLALLLASCSGPPPTVETITVSNSTGYDLDVQVTGRDRNGWLPMAIAEARSERKTEQVTDQGEVWIFRFLHWGDPVGEVSLTRGELERNGWHVEVPAEVEERLRQLGRPTSEEVPAT